MRRVMLESPYAAGSGLRGLIGRWLNRRYARRALRHSLGRDEAPIASHLLYTQRGVLRDHVHEERMWGIHAGLSWRAVAEGAVVYIDRGVSPGMRLGIAAAREAGLPVVFRAIENSVTRAQLALAEVSIDERGDIVDAESRYLGDVLMGR